MIDTTAFQHSKPAERFISADTARRMASDAADIAAQHLVAAESERRRHERGGAARVARLTEKGEQWRAIAAELIAAADAEDARALATLARAVPGFEFSEIGKPYAEELTPEGPQLVIPGCERKTDRKDPRQGTLFA